MTLRYLLLLLAFVFLVSMGRAPKHARFTIRQDNDSIVLKKDHTVVDLKKKPFTISFTQKPYNTKKDQRYNTRVAFVKDESLLMQVKDGAAVKDVFFFQEGTALANDPSTGVPYFFLSTADYPAHNYLFYVSSEDKNAKFAGQKKGIVTLECDVRSITLEERTETTLQDLPRSTLYLALFTDWDIDNIIDKGEYRLVTLKF